MGSLSVRRKPEVAGWGARCGGLLGGLLVLALPLRAQETPPPQGFPSAPTASQPAGRFRLGPFWVTPTLRIGTIGLDTNVFYTANDRRTDATASGGPGLEIVLPMRSLRLSVGGEVNYLYFIRTESQRKLGGDARSRLEWQGGRVRAAVQDAYVRTFGRPNFEVDRRVLQDQWTTSAELAVKTPGRLGLRTEVSSQRVDVAAHQDFLGADLASALSRDEYRALLGVRLGLTPKTFFVLEGDEQLDRFRIDASRDADSNRLYGGLEIESQTRLAGRAVGGLRLFRPRDASRGGNLRAAYATVDLTYHVGPRTHLSVTSSRDLYYSAFDPKGAAPTLTIESYGARIEKGLVGRLELFLFGRLTRLGTAGAITLRKADGDVLVAERNDTVREGGADLGYRFRSRLRVGIAAAYTNRRSTIADFGVRGLLVGGTVNYNPAKP